MSNLLECIFNLSLGLSYDEIQEKKYMSTYKDLIILNQYQRGAVYELTKMLEHLDSSDELRLSIIYLIDDIENSIKITSDNIELKREHRDVK